MLARLKTWWLQCGKSRPCPPISDDVLNSLLDEAKLAAQSVTVLPPNP